MERVKEVWLSNMHVYLCFLLRNEKGDVSFPVLFTMYEIYTWEKPDCQWWTMIKSDGMTGGGRGGKSKFLQEIINTK